MGFFLVSNPYTEYETGSQLNLYLASSRQFGQVEYTVGSEENYQSLFFYQLDQRQPASDISCRF